MRSKIHRRPLQSPPAGFDLKFAGVLPVGDHSLRERRAFSGTGFCGHLPLVASEGFEYLFIVATPRSSRSQTLPLSGTPIQNSIDDVYSLFKFLRYSPWDNYPVFERVFSNRKKGLAGVQNLRPVLAAICLRRTKEDRVDGRSIIELPRRFDANKSCTFSMEERDNYRSALYCHTNAWR